MENAQADRADQADQVDQADRVLARLARIEQLGASGAADPRSTTVLLDELRLLVREAEDWARVEGDARARAAVTKLREGAEGMR